MYPNKTVQTIDITVASLALGYIAYMITKDWLEYRKFKKAYSLRHDPK